MPVCKKCHTQWTWIETVKATLVIDVGFICPHCQNKQYETKESRRKTRYLNFVVIIPFILKLLFNISGIFMLVLFPLLLFVNMAIYPFLLRLQNTEIPLDLSI